MGKIIKLSEVKSTIKPNTATLVGGVFDLFHIGHLRYLRECSEVGRPLVVVVQTDKTVGYRKGFNRPIIRQNARAEIISHLDFVDYVLVLDKPSHYDKYLDLIKPKNYVFSVENMKYRTNRKSLILDRFPNINVVFLAKKVKGTSTTMILKKLQEKRDYESIKDPVERTLYHISDLNDSKIGKISALAKFNDQIISSAGNIDKKSLHAEEIVINELKNRNLKLEDYELYVLIPPCIMCARKIIESKIKKVFYLNPYGNDDGLKLLRENNISVKRYK